MYSALLGAPVAINIPHRFFDGQGMIVDNQLQAPWDCRWQDRAALRLLRGC
jgi:hypothetical protein